MGIQISKEGEWLIELANKEVQQINIRLLTALAKIEGFQAKVDDIILRRLENGTFELTTQSELAAQAQEEVIQVPEDKVEIVNGR